MKFPFLRELQILREMSEQEARSLLTANGATDFSKTGLLTFRKSFLRNHHPDRLPLGTPKAQVTAQNHLIASVNAAIDMLAGIDAEKREQRNRDKYPSTRARRNATSDDDSTGGTPPWAWAGHSGGMAPSHNIYQQDYRDMNYFKKQMWSLSKGDRKQQEYTIMAFDGHFFRNTLTVYASPRIFHEMAEAMRIWNSEGGNSYNTRAVFCYAKSDPRDLLLIFSDGKYYDPPKQFEHESFNLNPSNDQSFVRRLPAMLDALRAGSDIYA